MRNAILSVYQPSYLANLIPTMQSAIDQAFQNLPSSKEEDITFSDLSLKLSTDVIGQTAFGVDFGLSKPPSSTSNEAKNSDEVSEFIDEHMYSTTNLRQDLSASFSIIIGLIFPILQKPVLSILTKIPGTMDWKIEETSKKMSSRLDEIVEKRMKTKDRGSKDYLSLILNARDSERATKNIFTMEYLSASTYEHLLAGSTTISFTLASTVYLISDHPEVEKKLLEEIDGFGPPEKKPTADDLQDKFPYLDQVKSLFVHF